MVTLPDPSSEQYDDFKKMHQIAASAYYQSIAPPPVVQFSPPPVEPTTFPMGPRREFHMIWLVRASLLRRCVAEAIDILIVTAIASTCAVEAAVLVKESNLEHLINFSDFSIAIGQAELAAMPELAILSQIYTPEVMVFFLLYYMIMVSYQSFSVWIGGGASLGKWMAGIQVVNLATGRPPSLASAIIRGVVKTATWLICFLLFLVVFADLPRRAIHDQLADTIVVKKRERHMVQQLAQGRVPIQAFLQQQAG